MHTLTIKDNDDAEKPEVTFATDSSMVDEYSASFSVTVRLEHPVDGTVSALVEVSGTATVDTDFALESDSVAFGPGDTTATIRGAIVDDTLDEADETVVLTLKSVVNGRIGEPFVHTLTILDNDYVPSELTLFKQEVGTDDGKILTVLGPKALSVEPRGIAVDTAGNYYISDWGPSGGGAGEGSILFWPHGREFVVRIVSGLTKPGDVELSPDQRAILVAGPAGKVERKTLGLSIHLKHTDPFSGGTTVHVFGTGPEKVVKVSPDGYFHVPGLLEDDASKKTVDITVEREGTTKTFSAVPLGQTDGVYGHRLVELDF